MGMTPVQFWEESPYLAVAYRKAHRLRRQAENEHAWLQGLYIYDAFAVVLSNAFSKHSNKEKYFEHPIDIYPLTEQEKRVREKEEQEKIERIMLSMIKRQQQEKTEG